jgi:hypothetical protein
MRHLLSVFAVLGLSAILVSPSTAQTVEGSISGSVVDPSGLPVSGTTVTLTNQQTNFSNTEKTDSTGSFLFLSVLPGQYAISAQGTGFKTSKRENINLTPGDRLATGPIALQVGSLEQSVTVRAEGAVVDTENSDHKAIMTSDQLEMLQTRGRDMLTLLNNLPGVVGSDTNNLDNRATPNFNGVTNAMNAVMTDGQIGQDVSNPNYWLARPNLDAISEVTVLTNSFKAEYGRNGGAVVLVVTKSGTREFHGTGYTYFRNESLNANDFFNNLNGVPRSTYRYGTYGFTVGGPAYWPHKFNSSKQKLFFFESVEIVESKSPVSLSQWTVPTSLERQGNFSQSFNTGGNLIVVNDPFNNKTPFSGNIIPQSRIDPNGQALLDVFPAANFFNTAISHRNYNYNFQDTAISPTYQELFRIDYNATDKLRFFVRAFNNYQPVTSYSCDGQFPNWPLERCKWEQNMPGATFNTAYAFSPTVIAELSASFSTTQYHVLPANGSDFSNVSRAKTGVNLPQLYPGNNPLDVLPDTTFGGVSGAANITPRGDFPDQFWSPRLVLSGSLTKVAGAHTIKAGIYNEYIHYYRHCMCNFNGTFNFGTDSSNPNDTGYAYANALLGTFDSYSEASGRPTYYFKSTNFDWYVQDTWKASGRLTFDYGMRLSWFQPFYQGSGASANFIPADYNPAQKVVLFTPTAVGGKTVIVNPLTGAVEPTSYNGAIVPGVGNRLNGVVNSSTPRIPQGFLENRGEHIGPRFGFAYKLDEKTVFRAGVGVSFNGELSSATYTPIVNNTVITPTLYYGAFNTFNPGTAVQFPTAITGINQYLKNPTIYGMSAGIQRNLGFGTVIDVSYVGNQGRNLPQSEALNTIPYFSQLLPQNSGLGNNFIAPYIGYAGITYTQPSNSNYNSLQIQLNRRFAHRVQYGLSYTWSKSMGYTGNYPVYLSDSLSYGRTSLDRSQRLTVNWLYDIPSAGNRLQFKPAHWVLDGWQLSGIGTFQTGAPFAVSYSFSPSKNITGGGDWSRVDIVANPNLSNPGFNEAFNTAAIAAPTAAQPWGNAPVDIFRGPGICNFDVSLFKNFVVLERFKFQLRGEAYNVFNHPSFYNVNTSAQFNPNTGAQLNGALGQYTGDRQSRQIQVALRLTF